MEFISCISTLGMWEQPAFAEALLKNFLIAHRDILKNIPQRGNYAGKYSGNPYDPALRQSHKEREQFLLGKSNVVLLGSVLY
jgi:hypothetical protein